MVPVNTQSLPRSRASLRLGRATGDVWAVHTEAVERLERGEDIILLSVGDPDFPTPAFITEHVVAALDAHRTHYSPAAGEPRLRNAIADLETKSTGKPLNASQFVIFPGATAALTTIMACIADPGDQIIVPDPMYSGYRGPFDLVGIEPRTVTLRPPEFELDLDAVEAAIGANTKAVLVNTPGNPCGNIIAADKLAALHAMCRDAGIWLICDEVYSLIYFDEPHISLLKSSQDLSHAIVVDGLSKSHAMSGWRIGWAFAPAALADDLTRFAAAAFFGCSQFVQDAAAYALNHDEPQVRAMREEYRRRRDYVVKRINAIHGLTCTKPKAGMFVMMNTRQVAPNGDTFARRLLADAGVSTIPGSAFGDSIDSYVRVSLTTGVETLRGRARPRAPWIPSRRRRAP